MAKNPTLDQSIDRGLDDFGGFMRRRWWLVILILLVGWWAIVNGIPAIATLKPGDVFSFIVQIAVLMLVVVGQFVALFWFLGRPRLYWVMPGETGKGFDDYKGNPEVLEAARRIVILLRGVKSFKDMGGEISRGLLLVGPPGTGKSYLAQCISTEANVPFAYASAASFRAMFIGMDILMIKNLYRKARRLAREYGGCIIFMDEFDAIGMSRGGQNTMAMGGGLMGMMGGGTGGLNELLMQMDPPPLHDTWVKKIFRTIGLYHGRNQPQPVLTIGATNIPESLDAALLRPGRFDRKIVVAPPTDAYRGEVIEYYLDNVHHEPISLEKLVVDMMGYTPVAIKHVINEATVIAHFDGRNAISYRDICDARETHEHGIRYPRNLSLLEKRRLAYHEAGHAIAHFFLSPRHRVTHATIMKRLGSAGEAFVAFKPLEEIVTQSADEIFAEIETCLASRASEEMFLNTRLNGVGGDLHQATQLAIHYIAHWGMGESFFSASATLAPERVYTDPFLRRDADALLRQAYTAVRLVLEQHRNAVIAVAEALLVREELNSDEIETLIREAEAPNMAQIAASALSGDTSIPSLPPALPLAAGNGAAYANGTASGAANTNEGTGTHSNGNGAAHTPAATPPQVAGGTTAPATQPQAGAPTAPAAQNSAESDTPGA